MSNGRLDRILAIATPPPQPTGADLRGERRDEDVTVTALAAQMGISRQRIHTIEGPPLGAPRRRPTHPDPETVMRYRAALSAIVERRSESGGGDI